MFFNYRETKSGRANCFVVLLRGPAVTYAWDVYENKPEKWKAKKARRGCWTSVASAWRTTASVIHKTCCRGRKQDDQQPVAGFFFFFFLSNCTYKLSHYHQRQRCNGGYSECLQCRKKTGFTVVPWVPSALSAFRADLVIRERKGKKKKKRLTECWRRPSWKTPKRKGAKANFSMKDD